MATDTLKPPLSMKQVTELLGITRKTLRAFVVRGTFPPPLAIGGGVANGRNSRLWWSHEDVEAALLGHVARCADPKRKPNPYARKPRRKR
jgi:predicted DNA-binding transcriptional regulator AlpA